MHPVDSTGQHPHDTPVVETAPPVTHRKLTPGPRVRKAPGPPPGGHGPRAEFEGRVGVEEPRRHQGELVGREGVERMRLRTRARVGRGHLPVVARIGRPFTGAGRPLQRLLITSSTPYPASHDDATFRIPRPGGDGQGPEQGRTRTMNPCPFRHRSLRRVPCPRPSQPPPPPQPGAVSTPSPPDVGTALGGADSLHIVAWTDPVIDTLGHDPRSWYVEQFWLPVIGPPTIDKQP